ncbi:MAG: GHKL domain-containing protein [Deltaproteobacteria bacterium]|nr:GHKL domain-containing protein [Deltaproteobacteria bacterium]
MKMKLPKYANWHSSSLKYKVTFLHPLVVALVIGLFLFLILVMGIMDLGRLDKTLAGFMENRGLDIITTVENVAQENLDYLRQALKKGAKDDNAIVPLGAKVFSPQEALVKDLVVLAREIDAKWKAGHLSKEDLKEIADREKLWFVAVLNGHDKVVFKSGEFLKEFSPGTNRDAVWNEDMIIDLFDRFGKLNEMGYITLRRKDGSGAILIALNDEGLRSWWGPRIVIKKAIEEIGWDQQGLSHLVVINKSGRVLGQVGNVQEKFKNVDTIALDVLKGKIEKASRKVTFGASELLEITVPVRLDEKIVGFARLGLNRESSDRILKENRNRMIVSMIFIMAIGILSMFALYRSQKRYSLRMEEMGRRLHQAEKLSALGQLAAGVAHEIRNPLNAISMASQRIRREYPPDEEKKKRGFQHITGIISGEIKRLNRIVEEFVIFSRNRRLEFSDHSITYVLERIVGLIREEADLKDIAIKTVWKDDSPLIIPMDVDKLRQAFYNILKNAMEATSGRGTITISVEPSGKDMISIKISDTGCGLTPDEIDHIFNPEYTTKEKGLGLGLSLVHEIIRGHGGEIHVESKVGSGTTFNILLPVENREKDKE